MADEGRRETDDILKEIEKRISEEYAKAEKEIAAKIDDYLRRFEVKDALKLKALANGLITKEEYKQWRTGQVLIGERWKEMRDAIAQDLTNADKISRSIAFDHMPDVYAINHNYGTFQVEKESLVDTSYTLYDRHTVEKLMKDKDTFVPAPGRTVSRHIKEGKAQAWNMKQVQSAMMQGVLQGESISKIADRLEKLGPSVLKEDIRDWDKMTAKTLSKELARKNRNAAIRNARTLTTGVENAGRVASYDRANNLGIETQKQWLAALDFRTRHWHASLDGVKVDNDEPFENEYGEIMYPGDPSAEPANIFNCRCTLIASIKGFERDVSDMGLRRDEKLGDMTYDEWKAGKYEQTSDPITKQDTIAEIMKRKYGEEYTEYKNLSNKNDPESLDLDGVSDVTNEYIFNSTPGKGTIIRQEGFREKDHDEELLFAPWLKDMLGGKIEHNPDSQTKGFQFADFTWNGKLWELKTLSTNNPKTIDKRVQEAYHQIETNKGGAFFDMSKSDLTINKIAETIRDSQIKRCHDDSFDVLIRKDYYFVVMRINKK